VSGAIALHGGGEFQSGDEAFIEGLLAVVPVAVTPVRVTLVPTAASRHRPDLAGANGVAAFDRIGRAVRRDIDASVVRIVDHPSADDPDLAARLGGAHVIYLPGGDPDLIPRVFPGTRAWTAIQQALAGGAVLAGASAGAMAMGSWTWTPDGGMSGLGIVRRLVVAPHVEGGSVGTMIERFVGMLPPDTDALGLAERTGVIGPPEGPWLVAGEGHAYWLPAGAGSPLVLSSGGLIGR
jgi:cyanophycinase